MKNTELTLIVNINGLMYDVTFETDNCLNDVIKEQIEEQIINNEGLTEEEKEKLIEELEEVVNDESYEYEVSDWGDVEEYDNLHDIDLLIEIADTDINYDWDVISSAIECDITPENIDEAYSGEYKSNEEFAEEIAEQLGYINKDVSWPYTCIDWEQAAGELMYDYTEANGHYFRNF